MRGDGVKVLLSMGVVIALVVLLTTSRPARAATPGSPPSGAAAVFGTLAELPSPEQAQPFWRMGVEQAHVQWSNPLRVADDSALRVDDRERISSADAAVNWVQGRQSVGAWGRVEHSSFGRLQALDHVAHASSLVWDSRWAGDRGLRLWWRGQSDLSDALPRLDVPTGQRITQRIGQSGAQAEWGLHRRWALQAGWQRDDVRDAVPQLEPGAWSARVVQDTGSAGLLWRGHRALMLGLGRREVRGTQDNQSWSAGPEVNGPSTPEAGLIPKVSSVDDSQQVWEFQGRWTFSPGRWLGMRWSSGQGQALRSGSELPERRDIHSLRWEARWLVAASLSLGARLWRDEGLQAQVLQSLGSDARLWATSAAALRDERLDAQWDYSPRVRATLAIQRLARQDVRGYSIDSLNGSSLDQAWRDQIRRLHLAVVWQPQQAASLSCRATADRRRVWRDDRARVSPAVESGSVSRYAAQSVLCSLRIEWGGRVNEALSF